jgi:Tol biopolymer transport system component
MRWTTPTILAMALLMLNSYSLFEEPEETNYHNKILFASSGNGKEQLYMMNQYRTGIRQFTPGRFWHGGGRLSPDATQIVCNT